MKAALAVLFPDSETAGKILHLARHITAQKGRTLKYANPCLVDCMTYVLTREQLYHAGKRSELNSVMTRWKRHAVTRSSTVGACTSCLMAICMLRSVHSTASSSTLLLYIIMCHRAGPHIPACVQHQPCGPRPARRMALRLGGLQGLLPGGLQRPPRLGLAAQACRPPRRHDLLPGTQRPGSAIGPGGSRLSRLLRGRIWRRKERARDAHHHGRGEPRHYVHPCHQDFKSRHVCATCTHSCCLMPPQCSVYCP